ncbi:hypothetical protein [Streptomyces sp. HGB0020]|uniref:hypothetical protein n=1 Tax=Streptomyces sp. HGB0020 TaxID=1078086 RepID=UPI00034E7A00|nr:hypothetical protein [Streptomyces sp. HGB0020]EPD63138.1 hypothetical protein HMPREF1211_03479 [Streptomyces sp. HGB0020]
MINLGQVVAALAAGALLTLALMLVLDRHYEQRGTGQTSGLQEAERDDEEWLIEATRQITVERFEALQRDDDGLPVAASEDAAGELPYGAVVTRSKGHLRLIGPAVAAIVTAGTAARDAVRHHRVLTTAAVGTVATAAVVTTLTLTPWAPDNDASPDPSTAAPSATGHPSPVPTGSGAPSSTPPHASASPSSSTPGSTAGMAPVSGGTPSVPVTTGELPTALSPPAAPPAGGPTPTAPGGRPPTGGGTTPAPPPSSPPPRSSPPATSPGRACLDVGLPPLVRIGVCLLPRA